MKKDKNKKQRKGHQLRKEKRMRVQARVSITDLALCMKYFNIKDIRPDTRSDLMNTVVMLAAHVVRDNYPEIKDVDTANEAFKVLEDHGIVWNSKRAKKIKRRILEDEDSRLEGFGVQGSAYEENFKQAEQRAKQKINQQKEEEYMDDPESDPDKKARPSTGDRVAGGRPGNAPIKSEEELNNKNEEE